MSVYMTEEEQIQAIKKWWSRYSSPILVVLSVLMLSVSGYRYWIRHQEKVTAEASTLYEHLMQSFSNHDVKDIRSYSNQLINRYSQTIYADAARMTLAKLNVEKNHLDLAKSLLQTVAIQSKNSAFKQIAKIRLARLMIANKQFTEALDQFAVIDDSSYMTIVNELKGDIFVQQRDYEQAIQAYKQAIDQAKAQGIGNLFLEMKTNELAMKTQSMISDNKKAQAA